MFNYNDLPDTMYFGSSRQITELKNKVFLTPYKGIASLFIIDIDDFFRTFPKGYRTSCNVSYKQWGYPNDLLIEPLDEVNAYHNIVFFENESSKGQSSGYIHVIDITNIKNRMSLFTTNNPDREVIYSGDEPLTITQCFPHTVKWDFSFSHDDLRIHGVGTAEKV